MIDILTAPAAGAAAQELTSTPRLAPLVAAALGAYGDWGAATATLDACTGTAYEAEAARLVKVDAFDRYNRRVDILADASGHLGAVDALAQFTGNRLAVDAGIRYLHASNAAWEHALDNPEDYNGL
ncbi:hypothetical protein AB0331_15700 [Dietzia maris]|jgi:hypothetical protein|uniref:hypothetical protein n=1 Tax=Dietzia maris TaxID=37915 RepID=UPI00344C3529